MNIINNLKHTTEYLGGTVKHLNQLLQKEGENFTNIKDLIYVTCYSDIEKLETRPTVKNINTIKKDFGTSQNNYTHQNKNGYLIIINNELCKKINLSKKEVTAILLHELGHILNYYVEERIPTPMELFTIGQNKSYQDLIRDNNILSKEFYADYYAKKYGYGEHLINVLERINNNTKVEARINKLKSSEEFTGTIWGLTN